MRQNTREFLEMLEIVIPHMPTHQVKGLMSITEDIFTQEEVDAVVAFYKTKVGSSVMKKRKTFGKVLIKYLLSENKQQPKN